MRSPPKATHYGGQVTTELSDQLFKNAPWQQQKLYLKMRKKQSNIFDLKKFINTVLRTLIAVALIWFFVSYIPRAFSGSISINPIFFSFGRITVRWYGFILALAVLVAYLISEKRLVDKGVTKSHTENILFLTIIAGLVGARIGFVIQNTHYYARHIAEIFELWQGGLSIQGALIAGAIALIFLAKRYHVGFTTLSDSIAPQTLIGGSIGRFGNFFNEEIIGRPALDRLPWRMYVSNSNRPDGYLNNNFFHPVFLYESLLLALAYFLFIKLRRNFGNQYGFACTLVIYSLIRIIVEFWRIDYKPILWRFDLAQIVGFAILVFGVVLYLVQRRQNGERPKGT